jgi:hypothetical protein
VLNTDCTVAINGSTRTVSARFYVVDTEITILGLDLLYPLGLIPPMFPCFFDTYSWGMVSGVTNQWDSKAEYRGLEYERQLELDARARNMFKVKRQMYSDYPQAHVATLWQRLLTDLDPTNDDIDLTDLETDWTAPKPMLVRVEPDRRPTENLTETRPIRRPVVAVLGVPRPHVAHGRGRRLQEAVFNLNQAPGFSGRGLQHRQS